MWVKVAVVLLVLLKLSYCLAKIQGKPVIYVTYRKPFYNGSHLLNDINNDFYSAICSASYPIQWNFTGYISKSSFQVGSWYDRIDFIYWMYAVLQWASAYDYSLNIKCFSIEEPTVFHEKFAFHWNKTGSSLVEPDSNSTINSNIIPCATLSPKDEVSLYLTTSNGSKRDVKLLDKTLEYRPTEGFISQNVFDGLYTCIQNAFNITITAVSTLFDEFQSAPRIDFIAKFNDETIRLECSSASGHPLQISMFDTFMWNWPFSKDKIPVTNSSLNVSIQNIGNSVIADINVNSDFKYRIDGKVKCLANILSLNETKIVKDWTFVFLEAPILHLNHQHRVVECISNYQVSISVMWCEDIMVCSLCRDQWNKNIVNCLINYDGYEVENSTFVSKSIFSQHIGWAVCNNFGLTKHWIILETLKQRKYVSWLDAPDGELMRINELPNVLYTNLTSIFKFELLQYIFPMPPKFYIETENKTRYLIHNPPNSGTENFANRRTKLSSGRQIETNFDTGGDNNLNTMITLNEMVPLDAVAIHCVAQWWNSSETFSVSGRFITRTLMPPTFVNADNLNENSTHEILTVGETNRRLSCVSEGDPTPQIRWYFNDTDVLLIFPELQLISCNNGKCYLEFPEIKQSDIQRFSGEYLCIANNVAGSINQTIFLEIKEKTKRLEDAAINVIYISSAVIGGVIILALLTTLAVLTRRYRINKYLLRNLTQSEIDDFYEGRPGMNVNGASVETVDLMPFNKDYEIPLSDLHFTFSDASLLGSGEFAFVVRGLLLSSGKPVALKISKPSTDVTLFQSMLSEVKIMTYIGHHENVLSLIGVCTEEIRSRSLYIVTDICELGSLKSFLHKCKPQFFSLINANQEIDVSLLPQELSRSDNSVTTLDLIDFCAQIARGMEYLAYKSVIHADLATRNVLLTSDKTAKISDFGLSRKLYQSIDYVKKTRSPLPWRWMAVESLEKLTFSTKSDVWSYGVILYEIFTLGNAPFPNENWSHEFVSRLKTGMRMGRPEFSTPEIYTKMTACWESVPDLRPDFGTLRTFFEELYARYSASIQDKNTNVDIIIRERK